MGTMENLFVQIFERKKWIVDQVKHQTLLFDQQLASKCLLNGIAPPPWLLSSAPTAQFNKEELISGLLFPCPPPAVPYSGNYSSLYNKPSVTDDKGDLPDNFFPEVHPSNKGIHAGDRWSVSQHLPANDVAVASNGVQRPDSSAALSMVDRRIERLSDVSPEPACPLENFQRSKSRQRALELRNSAKSVKSNLHDENNAGVLAGVTTGSEIATLQHDHVQQLELVESVDVSKESCVVEEAKLVEFHGKENESHVVELIAPLLPGLQPPISCSSSDCVPYSKAAVISENEESPDPSDIELHAWSKGLVAADGLSDLQQCTVNDTGCDSNGVVKTDCGAASPQGQRNSGISDIDPKTLLSLARVQRSKSRQRAVEVRNSAKAAKSCLSLGNDVCAYSRVVTGSGIASPQSEQIHESELVKAADFDNESCKAVEAKVDDFQSKKKKSSNFYTGGITRSRSSVRQPTSMTEFSHAGILAYAGRSSGDDNNFCCPESSEQKIKENSGFGSGMVSSLPQLKQRKVGGKLTDAMSASQSLREDDVVRSNVNGSPVDKMDCMKQQVTEGSKSHPISISCLQCEQIHESEMVKTANFDHEGYEVEGGKVCDFQSKEKSSKIYSGRITRSRSSVQQPMRESMQSGSLAYAGRSSRDDNNICCPESSEHQMEENSAFPERGFASGMVGSSPQLKQRKVGGKLTDAVPASPILRKDDVVQSNVNRSPVGRMDRVEHHVTKGSESSPVGMSSIKPEPVHELELIKPADTYNEIRVVKEANSGDLQSKENGSNANSGRITRSKTCSQQNSSTRDFLNIGKSFYAGRSSSEDKNGGSTKSRQKSGKMSILSGEFACNGAEFLWPQPKRRKIERQLNDSLSASPNLREEEAAQSGVNRSPIVEMDQNGGCNMKGESHSSPKLLVEEDKLSSREDRSEKTTPFTSVQEESEVPLIPSFIDHATVDTKDYSDVEEGVANTTDTKDYSDVEGVVNTTSAILHPGQQRAMGGNEVILHLDDKLEPGNSEHLSFSARGMRERKCLQGGHGESFQCLGGSPQRQLADLIGADQIMPEFEGFVMETDNKRSDMAGEGISFEKLDLPKTTIERASWLEQLCKSACIHTPLSHFSTTYKLHQAPNFYQSVPNGLLECIDLRSDPSSIHDGIVKQLKVSYNCFNEEANQAFQGRSYSDCLPFSSSHHAWDIKNPFGSPVGKFWDITTPNSGSSEKRGSLNPELPCISEENENTDEVADTFEEGISSEVASPVGESCDRTTSSSSNLEKPGSLNPELPFITEENENTDEVASVYQEGMSSQVVPPSIKRKPLADITENPNLPPSFSEAEMFATRTSLESVKTEYGVTGTCNRVKQKLGKHTGNKERRTSKSKMSHSVSLGETGVNTARESAQNRFSKPKLSGKPSRGLGFADSLGFPDRETKHNNIVSNITSFIPLVKQKQAAAVITGKRGVKVKALEAAEAAKRLAQEKENERMMKKEALKLQRARLEQENLKQLELQKKKKEEERKKKEVDMAERKRQREEEERKEKERKRKRVVEAWKQQQENEEKLCAKKEKQVKCRAMDEQLNVTKASKNETGRDIKREKELGHENLRKMLKTEPKVTVVSTSDARETSFIFEVCEASTDCGDNEKAMRHLSKATENVNVNTNQNQEPSYDISPYKGSDNEDEEEDDIPNTKYVPSWASKSALALVISSQQSVNPEVIFPPESFCSISEVLLPRK